MAFFYGLQLPTSNLPQFFRIQDPLEALCPYLPSGIVQPGTDSASRLTEDTYI